MDLLKKGKPGFGNSPKSLPKSPPDCPILCNLVFNNFILAEEPFAYSHTSLWKI